MTEKIVINQDQLLKKLGLNISKNNYKESLNTLNKLCFYFPFKTQIFVQVFLNAWCAKILNMLDKNSFDDASLRIRSIYLLIISNKAFNNLLQIYFKKEEKLKYSIKLKNFDKALYFSMQSQYFYQNRKYENAELCVKKSLKEIKIFLKKKSLESDSWLLVRKCIKNVKNKKLASLILEDFLEN